MNNIIADITHIVSSGSGQVPVTAICEYDNGLPDSIKYEKILSQLTRLLKGSAPQSWNERIVTNIALKITLKETVATSKTYNLLSQNSYEEIQDNHETYFPLLVDKSKLFVEDL